MLDSRVDKVGVVLVFLSACCWVGYTTSFAIRIQQSEYRDGNRTTDLAFRLPLFSQWAFLVSGFLLYLTSFIHVVFGWHLCSTVLLMFLAPVNFVTGGGLLNHDGSAIYNYYTRLNLEISYGDFLPAEFGGALGAIVFYWIFLFMWVLSIQYKATSKRTNNYTIIND